jgi:hypothetical protein
MWENTIELLCILKEKKLQSKIFNQLNTLKVKSTKKIFLKKIKNKQKKKKRGKLKKKRESNCGKKI